MCEKRLEGFRNIADVFWASVRRLTRLVDSAKGMSGVVFAVLEAAFTEVKVVTVPAFESGAVYGEHLAAVAPACGRLVESGGVFLKKKSDTKLGHIHTSLQGEHWAPVPFQTAGRSSGTAEGSRLSRPSRWH